MVVVVPQCFLQLLVSTINISVFESLIAVSDQPADERATCIIDCHSVPWPPHADWSVIHRSRDVAITGTEGWMAGVIEFSLHALVDFIEFNRGRQWRATF